ncbi:acyltransferase [Luminiphilus sp.]|nr:acyltransferase [Luminiphilus sp.]
MNQFKAQNKRSVIDKIMSIYYRRRVGSAGDECLLDSGVHLMRYPKNIHLGSGTYVKQGARLCPCNEQAEIVVGNRTTIGYDSIIFASGRIQIGDDCMIAPRVYLVDSDHGVELGEKMNVQANNVEPIVVQDDVWVATGVVILKGTFIGQGCIVAANSVVKGRLEPFSIYAGAPARKVGVRR